jgi:hypothetical protein
VIWVRAWILGFGVAAFAACGDEAPGDASASSPASTNTPSMLRDTTGARFEVVGGDLDELRPLDGAELDDVTCFGDTLAVGEAVFWPGETGLPMVCFTDPDSGGPHDFTCRPLACEAAAECPAGAACVAGVCHYTHAPYVADPARVEAFELLALCAAEHPRTSDCPFTDPVYAKAAVLVDSTCASGGDLCDVPAECER